MQVPLQGAKLIPRLQSPVVLGGVLSDPHIRSLKTLMGTVVGNIYIWTMQSAKEALLHCWLVLLHCLSNTGGRGHDGEGIPHCWSPYGLCLRRAPSSCLGSSVPSSLLVCLTGGRPQSPPLASATLQPSRAERRVLCMSGLQGFRAWLRDSKTPMRQHLFLHWLSQAHTSFPLSASIYLPLSLLPLSLPHFGSSPNSF